MGKDAENVLQDAEKTIGQYPYVLIYRSSGIWIGERAKANTSDLFNEAKYQEDGNLEARFFSKEGELHLFASEGRVKAVSVVSTGEKYMEERYVLAGRFRENIGNQEKIKYSKLVVRRLLDQDEDGQTFVKRTCLAGLEA